MYILITWSYLSTKERYFNKLKIKIFSRRLFLKISQRILKIVTDFKLYTEKTIQTAGLKSNVDTITQRRLRYFAYCFPVLHLPSHELSPYLSQNYADSMESPGFLPCQNEFFDTEKEVNISKGKVLIRCSSYLILSTNAKPFSLQI